MTIPILDGNGSLVYFDAEGDGSVNAPYRMKQPSSMIGPVHENFSRRLDLVGDGSGSYNQNVDGSVTPQDFKIKPAAGEILHLTRIIVYVQDSGAFDAEKWGNNITMTTGIDFIKVQASAAASILSDVEQFKIKTSGDMSSVCFDYNHVAHGTGDEYGVWRYTFEKSGNTIRLVGGNDDEYIMRVNDDLTGLIAQYGTVQGYFE